MTRILRPQSALVVLPGMILALLVCGTAFGQTASVPPRASLKLIGVIIALPSGTPWMSMKHGWLCINPTVETWASGRVPQALPPYSDLFKTELEQAGYKVITPGEDNLFDANGGSADYEVAALIVDEHIDGCASGITGEVRGSSAMKMDWQIYSPVTKQVVAHVSTSASTSLANSVAGGVARLLLASFAGNIRELAANADFRAAVSTPQSLTNGIVMPGQQDKIPLLGSLKAPATKISDAVGSVVTVLSGDGSGSGVLVSSDGYMLTDAHVVGDEKTVHVRWSDGIEAVAEVVRVAKDRDVAIIKTNPRDRIPLAIKRGIVVPGQRVYAIGSPMGQVFEGTVSSGVISATRTINGLRYIQSDTTVSQGSSGGPLLDANGAVIGLTDLGVQNDGPVGLNLFTPIGDAMDFLSLEQQ